MRAAGVLATSILLSASFAQARESASTHDDDGAHERKIQLVPNDEMRDEPTEDCNDAASQDDDEDSRRDDEHGRRRNDCDSPHEGFFSHLDAGLGYAWIAGGDLGPEPGFRPIDDLRFAGPVLGVSVQGGIGFEDTAIALEALYEHVLTRVEDPSIVNFHLLGLGLGVSHYSDDDWIVGAQLRWVGLLLWRSQIPCFWDRGDITWGPGVGLTLGKEWFGHDDFGLGLALQGNYAYLQGDPELRYASALLQLSLTRF